MMANISYRIMSLAERGLMDSMRRECWVNHAVPAAPDLLAKVLGFPADEVRNALPAVMPFFTEMEGRLICPELENYRAHLNSIRERQSTGGKLGAAISHSKPKSDKRKQRGGSQGDPVAHPVSSPLGTPGVNIGSSVQYNPVQSSPDKTSNPLSLEPSDTPNDVSDWAKDYERASNGF